SPNRVAPAATASRIRSSGTVLLTGKSRTSLPERPARAAAASIFARTSVRFAANSAVVCDVGYTSELWASALEVKDALTFGGVISGCHFGGVEHCSDFGTPGTGRAPDIYGNAPMRTVTVKLLRYRPALLGGDRVQDVHFGGAPSRYDGG